MYLYQHAYRLASFLNRKTSLVRPHRLLFWLGDKAYRKESPHNVPLQWVKDNRGAKFYLNPYYLLDRSIIAFGDYDASLHRFIDQYVKPGMVCMDVGANIGFFSVHLGQVVGHEGKVYCFEPIPSVHKRLQQHIEENNVGSSVKASTLALSNEDGEATIHFADENLTNQGMASIVLAQSQLANEQKIRTVKLDTFVQSEGLTRLDFVKLDIQGAETFFLEGGKETLNKMKPILCFEVAPDELVPLQLKPKDLLLQIEELGYTNYTLLPNGERGSRVDPNTIDDRFHADTLCAFPS